MNPNAISDERLNAFIDDELDAAEKSEVFEALAENSALSKQACELRQLSELVRHAYSNPPRSGRFRKKEPRRISPFGQAAAAALLVALGATLGWIGHQQPVSSAPSGADMRAMVWGENDRAFHSMDLASATSQNGLKRVILHLNTSSPAKFETALTTAERLLKEYATDSHGAEIEVVANASAIKLLRSGYSPYAARVRALQEKYFNLTFIACKDAMDHIRELEDLNSDIRLLPGVEVTPSALEHILERMNEGWVYLNV
jgi:intracellular sulfur oxidation DsrE/DsrF family protein